MPLVQIARPTEVKKIDTQGYNKRLGKRGIFNRQQHKLFKTMENSRDVPNVMILPFIFYGNTRAQKLVRWKRSRNASLAESIPPRKKERVVQAYRNALSRGGVVKCSQKISRKKMSAFDSPISPPVVFQK
eukprot:928234-Rhodomonas_salina.1